MKRFIIIPAVLVLLIGGLVAAPNFVDWNSYKAQALTQAKTLSGLDVDINGNISLALLPSPRVYVEDVVVKDPNPASDKPILALKRLDVRIALLPLLSGQVVVNSFNLEEPQVRLTKNAEGKFNYSTPEIEALMAQKPSEDAQKQPVAVSFQNISIEHGQFYYKDAAAKVPVEIADLDIAVKADSLKGPFDANGQLKYGEQALKFTAKTGEIDADTQSASLNLSAELSGLHLKYAGVASLGAAPSVQGEIDLAISSLDDFMKQNGMAANPYLSGSFEAKGVLTANAEKGDLKNATIKLNGQTLDGEAAVVMNPLSFIGAFRSNDTLDLDKLAAQGGGQSDAKGGDLTDLAASLPQTLELPVLGPVKFELSVPAAVINKQMLKDVSLAVTKTEKGFSLGLSAADIPGGGAIKGEGKLEYANKAKSQKAGSEIYSEPSASFSLKGKSSNIPETVQAFSGLHDLPLIKDAKTALFDFSGQVVQGGLALDKGIINLDDKAFAVSGSMKKQKDSARSVAKIKIVADSLDFDEIMGADKAPAKAGGDPFAPLKTLALPYDLTTDITVNNATLQGHQIEGLRAALSVVPNALILTDVGAKNFVDSFISISGKVGDLKNMGGLDIAATLNTPDPYKLADALKIDATNWPKNLGTVKANIKATGSLDALDANADIGALGGNLIFKGKVGTPMTTPALSNVALQVKHPNMAQALKNFGASAPEFKSFAGPVDLYTNVDMNGKTTSLSGIKATIAGTSMTGGLKYDAGGALPNLTGQLKFGRLVLQSTGVVTRAGGTTEVRPASTGGKWSSTPIDTAFLHSMNADLDIAAESILYETWDMKAPALKVTLSGGTLQIKDLNAGLFDGQIALQGHMGSAAKGKPVGMEFTSKITGINMGALAKALSGTSRVEAEGDVSLNFTVAGSGLSQSDLVSSLKGNADMTGRKVVMKGFDLAGLATALMDSSKPLDRLQQVIGASTSGGETAFDTVDGNYTIANGIVTISSMKMDGPAATVVSTGNASLPRWYLDTVHMVTLKNAREVEPFKVTIQGPLDNPGNTFGKGMFDTLVRNKLKDQVVEKLPGLLGDKTTSQLQKLGILPQKAAPVAAPAPAPAPAPEVVTEPAAGDVVAPVSDPAAAPVEPAPVAAELAPEPEPLDPKEEAIKGLINGLLR